MAPYNSTPAAQPAPDEPPPTGNEQLDNHQTTLLREVLDYMITLEDVVRTEHEECQWIYDEFDTELQVRWEDFTDEEDEEAQWYGEERPDGIDSEVTADLLRVAQYALKYMVRVLVRDYGVEALLAAGYRDWLKQLQEEVKRYPDQQYKLVVCDCTERSSEVVRRGAREIVGTHLHAEQVTRPLPGYLERICAAERHILRLEV